MITKENESDIFIEEECQSLSGAKGGRTTNVDKHRLKYLKKNKITWWNG